eukprot:2614955-Prorocentrum_lima.AAC.1
MTSSLVGSEMCIRDSAMALHLHARQNMAGDAMAGCDAAATVLCCVPVSYTHLTLPTICSV